MHKQINISIIVELCKKYGDSNLLTSKKIYIYICLWLSISHICDTQVIEEYMNESRPRPNKSDLEDRATRKDSKELNVIITLTKFTILFLVAQSN